MGMTASQARFLCLTARKSNVEFAGQQINQQRTTLSNQSASYYSELCNMCVPTPPSVEDYTKVTYTFDDGALTNTITAMLAKENNAFSVSYIQQWQDDYAIVPAASSLVEKQGEGDDAVYKIGITTLSKLDKTGDKAQITDDMVADDAARIKDDPYLRSLTKEQRKEALVQEAYYVKMLNEYAKNDRNASDDWYVKYTQNTTTGAWVPSFYNATEVTNASKYKDGFSTGRINCYSIGSTMKTQEVLNQDARIEKDSSGRYVALTIYPDGIDKPERALTYNLTANTSTDEDAYNDAMNQYNYDQQQYDKKIQDINSKLEIIQQQDKSLELNLKSLDTEENAINTEVEAVKKVIQKNVESSFKTFG